MKEKIKSLFIISKDFGELYNAVFFAEALSPENEVYFLMPQKMYELNCSQFNFPVKRYSSFSDLQKELIKISPRLCFLFSGYLLTVNNLLSAKDLSRFLKLIDKKRIRLCTTDPWLNIWPTLNTLDYSTLNFNDPLQSMVYSINMSLKDKFNDYYHLYNFSLPSQAAKRVKKLNYFSKKTFYNYWQKQLLNKSFKKKIPELQCLKFWFFVVSGEDAVFLRNSMDLLAAKLQETLLAGRVPVLIAPRESIEYLKSYLKNPSDILLFTECSLEKFKLLLFSAEYVFYWNVFSATILSRVLNGGQVFCFDHGHMVKVFPPFLELGRKVYYGESNLFVIDPRNKLILQDLKKIKWRQKRLREYLVARVSGLPTPNKIIKILLGNYT